MIAIKLQNIHPVLKRIKQMKLGTQERKHISFTVPSFFFALLTAA